MNRIIKTFFFITLLAFLSFIASCGGGGGSTGSQEPAANLSGKWDIVENVSGNCPGSTYPQLETYLATIVQTGNKLTVSYYTDDGPANLNGTISGNSIKFSGNQPSSSGTTKLSFSGTVSADEQHFDGTATWSWTNGSSSCNGSAEISATMLGVTGEEPAADLSGMWDINYFLECEGGAGGGGYIATIIQSQNDLTIAYLDYGFRDLEYSGIGTISGTSVTWNLPETAAGGTNEVSFLGTVSSGSDSISGYDSTLWSEPCPWQVYATRLSSGTPSAWKGTWTSEAIGSGQSSGSFDVIYTLNGTVMEGQINGHNIYSGFMDINLKGSLNGNDIVFGDIDDQITYTGTLGGDAASGTYTSLLENDTGTWEATRIVP